MKDEESKKTISLKTNTKRKGFMNWEWAGWRDGYTGVKRQL
jgi:hypothetical protein